MKSSTVIRTIIPSMSLMDFNKNNEAKQPAGTYVTAAG
jgi:hypothetical protein